MKKCLLIFLSLLPGLLCKAQDTVAVIKANFGVEADLRANYYGDTILPGTDDWFNKDLTDTSGSSVIDTSLAAQILGEYAINPSYLNQTFQIPMAYDPYTVKSNKLLLAAAFVRDYHGLTDSTVFGSGSSKNGMSPAD